MKKPKLTTLIAILVTIVAIIIVATQLDFSELGTVIITANPLYTLITILISFLALGAGGINLIVFTPQKLKISKIMQIQLASGYMSLMMPAGIGPATVNMRFLNRLGVKNSVSLAIVSVIQIIQFAGTLILLFLLGLLGAKYDLGNAIDLIIVFWAFLIILGLFILALLIPKLRHLFLEKVLPFFKETLMNFKIVLAKPQKVILGILSVFFTSFLYALAYYTALLAFDIHPSFIEVALVYLVSNAVATMIPTPGGIGTVESALTLAFAALGIPVAQTLSATLLFRLADYWLRIPAGFVAMRISLKKGDL